MRHLYSIATLLYGPATMNALIKKCTTTATAPKTGAGAMRACV